MTLTAIADDLWQLGGEQRLPGGARFPLRMTVVRLPDRSLVLHSPVPFGDGDAAAVAQLGEVAHVIAPNNYHHLSLEPTLRRFPRAAAWLAPGVVAKHPDVKAAGVLDDTAPAAWRDHLDQVHVGGAPRVGETVFFHRASRTLLTTDLVFHITEPANLRTRMVLRMVGVGGGRLGCSRMWNFLVKDRAAAAASVARIAAWQPQRLVPAHGAVYEGDVIAALAPTLPRVAGRLALPEK